jgi:quercetin dioxygenase-like cupin family protein
MKQYRLSRERSRKIEVFNSQKVTLNPIMRMEHPAQVILMDFEPGGILGMHPATCDQLFLIVEGEGWVRTSETEKIPLRAGESAFWTKGEEHESGTEKGMKVMIFEGDQLNPERLMSEALK